MKKKSLKQVLCVVLTLCLLSGYAEPFAMLTDVAAVTEETVTYYSEDFNSITQLDWTPRNHEGKTPSDDDKSKAYSSVETDPLNASNQVMKLNIDKGRSQWVGETMRLSDTPDVGVLSYKLYLGGNTGTVTLPSFRYITNSSQGAWSFAVMAVGGKLQLALTQTCNIRQIVYTATETLSDEWHDIDLVQKVSATPKAVDYALFVDRVLVCQGQLNTENCSYLASANLSMTGIAWTSSWTAAEAYIDDLKVTEYVPATGVTLTDSQGSTSKDVEVGESFRLEAGLQPSHASIAAISYSSSDTSVATVDESGRVIPVGVGTATITATLENCAIAGTYSYTAAYTVNVKAGDVVEYYSESFNNITELDWLPRNHEGKTPSDSDLEKAYASIVSDPKNDTNKVMKLNITNGRTQWVGANKVLSDIPEVGVLSYKLYLGANKGTITLPSFRYVTNNSQGAWSFAVMAVGGKLQLALTQTCNIRQIAYTSAEALSDEWHDITLVQKLTADPKALDYALFVDGVLVYQGQLNAENCSYIQSANLTMNGIAWTSSWTDGEAYIDELRVTEYVPATGMKLTDANGGTSASLTAGDTIQLKVTAEPASTSCAVVTYSSSNSAVASVDAQGKIKALSEGTATITATVSNCALAGTDTYTAAYKVSVENTVEVEYYNEDFEAITELDWIPKNHAGGTPTDDDLSKSYASVEVDPLNADNKVMKLNIEKGRSHCVGAITALSAKPDVGVLSYKVYLADNEGTVWLPSFRYTSNGSQGAWGFTLMAVGNKLQLSLTQTCNIRQTVYTASEALSNAWHDIKLVQKVVSDPKTLDYALYVDGLLVCYGQLNTNNSTFIGSANLSMTGIAWSSSWTAGVAYIDNLRVTEYVSADYIPVEEINLVDSNGNNSAVLYAGEHLQLTANLKPNDANSALLTFTSSDESVATVSPDGKVSAVGLGSATITATAENWTVSNVDVLTATYTLTVKGTTEFYREDFDDIAQLDWIPKNHENKTPSQEDLEKAYASIVADPKNADNKVMKLNIDKGRTQWVGAVKPLAAAPNIGVLKYKLYLGENTGTVNLPSFRQVSGSGSQGAWFFSVMAVGGKLQLALCQTCNVRQIVYTAEEALSDQWHDITLIQKMESNPKALYYALYVDDVLVNSGHLNVDNSSYISTANISMTGLSWSASWTDGEAYIDNISVTQYDPSEYVAAEGIDLIDANGNHNSVIYMNDELQLNAQLAPLDANSAIITYTSSDETVATVNSSGKVTAVGMGTATITATLESWTAKTDEPITSTYEVSVAWEYYNEDFSDITEIDWIPKNHENKTPSDSDLSKSYASIVKDPLNSSNKVMKLNITTGRTQWVGAIKELSSDPTVGVLSYKLYLADNTGTIGLPSFRHLDNGSQGAWFFSVMAVGDKLQLALCQTCNVRQIVYTSDQPLSKEWHEITLAQKVSNNPKTLDYAFYVDGVLVSQGQLNPDNSEYIEKAHLSLSGLSWTASWTDGKAYIDDISVSDVVLADSFDSLELAEGYRSNLYKGGITKLVPVFSPVNTSFSSVKYTSSNEKVATVDSNGKVTAVGVGTAIIRAEALPVSGVTTGDCREIEITVKEPYFDILWDYEDSKQGSQLWAWEIVDGKECPGTLDVEITTDAQDSLNQALTFTAKSPVNDKTYNVRLKKELPNYLTGTKAVLSYRFKMGNIDQILYLPNFSNTDNQCAFTLGAKLDYLMLYDPEQKAYVAIVRELGVEEWYDLTIVLDTERNVYDIYLDGELIYHSKAENDLSGFNGIDWGFYSSKAGANVQISIDDLKITNFIEASDVTVAQADVSVAVGGTIPLELVFTPENASYRSAKFTSSDEKILTVDMNGVITGEKAGSATVTIEPYSFPWKKLTVNVTVEKNIPVTELIVSAKKLELPVGGHTFLETSVLPENAKNQRVKLSTEDTDIIYVDEWGEVVALKSGTAEITVSADNGKVKETVKVTVTEPDTMQTIYVAPDGSGDGESAATPTTLKKALDIIGEMDKSAMTGNIVVSMAPGYYRQMKTLELNETHGGNGMYSVIFRGEDGGEAVIGGGFQISGSSFTEVDGMPGVYAAELAEGIRTRQIYVDNIRTTRARSTKALLNAEHLYDASGTWIGYICDDDGVLSAYAGEASADDLEFVYMDAWVNSRVGVERISLTSDGRVKIIMDQPAFANLLINRAKMAEPECIQYYENGMGILDEPGEWYLDERANMLYYIPRAFEDMSQVTVTVPVAEDLVMVIGTNYDKMVQNIRFESITFADATWMRPSTDMGHICAQNNYLTDLGYNYMNFAPDASITVKRANSVSFTGCTFARLGTTGLKLIEGVQNSPITDCNFYEISGGAIQIGDAGYGAYKYNRINDYNPPDIRKLMKNCDVVNNYIHTVATEYYSAAAIGVGTMANARLSNNEIYDIPYSGFHIGYGWNAKFDSIMQNMEVTNNFIHDFMGVGIYDGGAIYTLGNSGGNTNNWNVIAQNYIRNQMNGPGALYADNGTTYWSWEENVVDLSMVDNWEYLGGAPKWMLLNTYANNVRYKDNYTTTPELAFASQSVYNVTQSGTTLVEGGNWPEEAQAIIAAAGLNANAEQLRNGQIEVVRSNLPDAETNLIMYSGDTFQIELGLADGRDNLMSFENADVLAYEIYNEAVATVTDNGFVTAVGPGATTLCVYVTSNDVLYVIEREIYVDDELVDIALEGVKEDSLTMSASVEYQMKLYGITKYGRHIPLEEQSYETSVDGVLTVDATHTIMPTTDGTTDLTVIGTAEGSTASRTWKIIITPKVDFVIHDAAEIFDSTEGAWVGENDDKYSPRNIWTIEDGDSITSYMKGWRTFAGRKYYNELLTFDLTLGANSTWPTFYLRAQDTQDSAAGNGTSGYVICMGDKGIQLQRFNGKERTVMYGVVPPFESIMGGNIKNHPLIDKGNHRVQIGALTVEGMVRLYMKIDDVVIFDYWDTSADAITEAGYFGIHGAPPADSKLKDFFFIRKADVTGLEAPQFTRDTLGNAQYGVSEEEKDTAVMEYKILSDEQIVWNRGTEAGATVIANGNPWQLLGICINGERLDPKNFSVSSGSTVVTLNADYLESQPDGNYTVTFLYSDGEVSTDLTVAPAVDSEEPVQKNTFLWIAIVVASACAVLLVIVIVLVGKKKKNSTVKQTEEQESK